MTVKQIRSKIKEVETNCIEAKGVLKAIKEELKKKYGILSLKELNEVLGIKEAEISGLQIEQGNLKAQLENLDL